MSAQLIEELSVIPEWSAQEEAEALYMLRSLDPHKSSTSEKILKKIIKSSFLKKLKKAGFDSSENPKLSSELRKTAIETNASIKQHELLNELKVPEPSAEDYSKLMLAPFRDYCFESAYYLHALNPLIFEEVAKAPIASNICVGSLCELMNNYGSPSSSVEKKGKLFKKIHEQKKMMKFIQSKGISLTESMSEEFIVRAQKSRWFNHLNWDEFRKFRAEMNSVELDLKIISATPKKEVVKNKGPSFNGRF